MRYVVILADGETWDDLQPSRPENGEAAVIALLNREQARKMEKGKTLKELDVPAQRILNLSQMISAIRDSGDCDLPEPLASFRDVLRKAEQCSITKLSRRSKLKRT